MDGEADALLAGLAGYDALVLAVSGGADSTALLHLVAGWHRRRGGQTRLLVVTVDHRLRPEAADEAKAVTRQAAALGLEHRTVTWDAAKPTTGLQAAARAARYELLMAAALDFGTHATARVAIVTAHTADDQAETLLMRLARGSGVDGLSSIPAVGRIRRLGPDGTEQSVAVLRPLLAVTRDRLLATLAAAGIGYIDDPSNADDRFERVRMRQVLRHVGPLGMTAAALARTAARMETVRSALDVLTARLMREAVTVHLDTVFAIDLDRVAGEPHEIGIRLLREVLRRAGGDARQAELSSVEDAARRLRDGRDGGAVSLTLGRCRLEGNSIGMTDGRRLLIYRETDRPPGLPTVALAPGGGALWDDRIWVSISKSHSGTVEIGPLGDDAARLAQAHKCLAMLPVPLRTLSALPAFRHDGGIVAVPMLATFARKAGDASAAAALAGPLEASGDGGQPCLRARRGVLLAGDEVNDA